MEGSFTILSVQNLSVSFGSKQGFHKAVDHISYDLHQGKTLGIVGESGSGKSVSSLAIMRLLPTPPAKVEATGITLNSESESISILGLSDSKIRNIRGRRIAMIFQESMTSLNPIMTVGYQVMEPMMKHLGYRKSQAFTEAVKILEQVRLPNPEQIMGRYPHQLSGGQKQRIMIAMAISCKPDVLIADEPTTALDVTVQRSIIDLLKQLQAEMGMSMIFITHDLGVIAEVADDVAVMYGGKMLEYGTVNDILHHPKHPYTQALLACRPPINIKLRRLPIVADFMHTTPEGELINTGKGIEEMWLELTVIEQNVQPKSNEPILVVQGLTVNYKQGKHIVNAVNNVSVQVKRGEVLGLVGESGCGKTTLGRSIIRLVEPSAGTILFDKNDVASLDGRHLKAMRKRMQIIFQDPYSSLNPKLTVGYAITEPMLVHNLHHNKLGRRAAAVELLNQVGIPASAMQKYPHEFSGGQRQRICIARALAVQPDFIICDESVSALDVSVQAQVLNLLNELKERLSLTYIFISHDMGVVRFMSDHIAVMKQGEIVEYGEADKVFFTPQQEYTKSLIHSILV